VHVSTDYAVGSSEWCKVRRVKKGRVVKRVQGRIQQPFVFGREESMPMSSDGGGYRSNRFTNTHKYTGGRKGMFYYWIYFPGFGTRDIVFAVSNASITNIRPGLPTKVRSMVPSVFDSRYRE
jgi:hypothetical protein